MSWTVERVGTTVRIRIELPVDDREDLYDAIKTEMAQKTSEIAIPVALPGASRTCANMLGIPRRTLDNTGIPFAPAG